MSDKFNFKPSKPDPRILIFQVIVISSLNFIINRPMELLVLFILMDVLVIFHGMVSMALRFVSIYATLYLINILLVYFKIPYITMMFSTLISVCIRLFPVYISCIILVQKVYMDELLFAMEKINIPKVLMLPLAVVYRYIPTIRSEIRQVRESLKMRGLNVSFLGILINPVNAVENFMIPLLIRSGKIAEELSAASLCKGLDMDSKRTSCTDVRFQTVDIIYCLGCLGISFLFIIVHNNNILG